MRRIETLDDIAEGLDALVALDPRLGPIRAVAGDVPLRRRQPGFQGLAGIITGQQLSIASARAIWARVEAAIVPFDAATFAAADDATLRACGLSAAKVRTLRAVAAAECDGQIACDRMGDIPAAEAHAAMVRLHGIGPWTADIFLLFCVGHADIWPAGDLALAEALRLAFDLDARPAPKAYAALAEPWSPWRGVAARLFWAYYAARKDGREGVIG